MRSSSADTVTPKAEPWSVLWCAGQAMVPWEVYSASFPLGCGISFAHRNIGTKRKFVHAQIRSCSADLSADRDANGAHNIPLQHLTLAPAAA